LRLCLLRSLWGHISRSLISCLPALRPKVTQGASITALSSLAAKGRSVRLLEGPDHYETAIQVSKQGFPGVLLQWCSYRAMTTQTRCVPDPWQEPTTAPSSMHLLTDLLPILKLSSSGCIRRWCLWSVFKNGNALEGQVKAVLARATVNSFGRSRPLPKQPRSSAGR